MEDNKHESLEHHRTVVQSVLQTQIEMSEQGAPMFDYIRQLNVWAAQACGQLLSVEQRLCEIASLLAAQQSRDGDDGGSAGGEGKKT